jgi:hypothetical protein
VRNGFQRYPPLLDPDVSPTLSLNEVDWEFLELQASAALSRRDFVALDELIVSTLDPLFKQLLRAISFNAQGHIGEAFRIITSFEHQGIIERLPDRIKFDVLRHAALIYSTTGHSEKSRKIYPQLKQMEKYQHLAVVQRVQLLRNELNHCMQTAQSRNAYYDSNGQVLRHFDHILKECLCYVGSDLDSVRRFHPVVGPAIICMKEYREWIATAQVNRSAATDALDRQLQAIMAICEHDLRLGPIRFSPLVSQHIRAGNWDEAANILAQQRQIWASFDPSPEISNTLEFATHKILKGIVQAFGFSDYDGAQAEWREVRTLLGRTRTNRFQAIIAGLFLEIADTADIPAARQEALKLNGYLIGQPFGSDYYFFGRD